MSCEGCIYKKIATKKGRFSGNKYTVCVCTKYHANASKVTECNGKGGRA